MVCELFKASAPGSFMISGEHAILRGELGLVAALDKRIHVELTPRADQQVVIQSDTLGDYQADLAALPMESRFSFVLATVESLRNKLPSGFNLKIRSEFSHQMGLSSSAAVTVATLAVLVQFSQLSCSEMDLFYRARNIIQQVQKTGSGADIAAAVFGGIQAIQCAPLVIEAVPSGDFAWHLVYTGYKTATSEVVAKVNSDCGQNPEFYRGVFKAIGAASQKIKQALQTKDNSLLGEWLNRHSGLQAAMGLVCTKSQRILDDCLGLEQVYGAKLSGSGLGDCVLVLGELPAAYFSQQMAVTIGSKGLLQDG